jgi:hypothetical protein
MGSQEKKLSDIVPLVPDEHQRRFELAHLLRLGEALASEATGDDGWREVASGGKMLFSAPHEVAHVRDGVLKPAEKGTGAFAFALAGYVGGRAIIAAGEGAGDKNWDLDTPYVQRAKVLAGAGIVIDLHMMKPRGPDVCIGLGPHPELSQDLWRVFVEEAIAAGLRVAVNWPFAANSRTVTAQLQRQGVPAIQLELSWECFDPEHIAMARAWSAIARAVRKL